MTTQQDNREVESRLREKQLLLRENKENLCLNAECVTRMLQHPRALVSQMDNDVTFPLIWDSGASMCLTSHKSDFVGEIKPWENSVQGISSGLQIKGKGNVCWTLLDVDGKFRRLKLPAFYAPEARTRLLSTSVFCAKYPLNTISMTAHRWTVNPNPRVKDERPIDIYINPLNNLPQTTCSTNNLFQRERSQ